jgi:hypothetical protein
VLKHYGMSSQGAGTAAQGLSGNELGVCWETRRSQFYIRPSSYKCTAVKEAVSLGLCSVNSVWICLEMCNYGHRFQAGSVDKLGEDREF